MGKIVDFLLNFYKFFLKTVYFIWKFPRFFLSVNKKGFCHVDLLTTLPIEYMTKQNDEDIRLTHRLTIESASKIRQIILMQSEI